MSRVGALLEGARAAAGWNHRPQLLVLCYHRVCDVENDPNRLSVSPERFAAHLECLRGRFTPLLLSESVARLARGDLPPRAVALTFDDGYADNVAVAYPLLQRHAVPATIFVATHWIDSAEEFYWDEVERIFLRPGTLPRHLTLDSPTGPRSWDLGHAAVYSAAEWRTDRDWNVQRHSAPTPRHRAFSEVMALLSVLDGKRRGETLRRLREWAGVAPTGRETHRPLRRGEIAALAGDGLTEVGAHSVSHVRLAALSAADQAAEVAGSKAAIEAIIGRPVTSFAYPFGGMAYDNGAVEAVRAAGYRVACTTTPALATRRNSPLKTPRFLVRDWEAGEFAQRVEQWWERRW
ncbi:MAG: polysaccharide deacetylase family protein [Deltaproteobacteria bacterium]|nr:polysaccharide deacetylase family protein [Deltaproteobacteria bacterium]